MMITVEMRAKLDELNGAVADAIFARTQWLDDNMAAAAKFAIGDEVFDADGKSLGIVAEHYRYHANINPFYDTSLDIHYRFVGGDNTSRQSLSDHILFTRQQVADRLRAKAERITQEGAA